MRIEDKWKKISEITKASHSDLALAFGVSREKVRGWVSGEDIPEVHHLKIQRFYEAIMLFDGEAIMLFDGLELDFPFRSFRRAISNGQNLYQIAGEGGDIVAAGNILFKILSAEAAQRSRLQKLPSRNTKGRYPESWSMEECPIFPNDFDQS